MSNVVRWQFEDVETAESYTVELNPNEMSSYLFGKQFDFGRSTGATHRMAGVRQRAQEPFDFSFGGVVRSKDHHDALISWQRRPGKVRITDHLGRTFEVMLRSLDLKDRRSLPDAWRFTYTFSCLFLRRIA